MNQVTETAAGRDIQIPRETVNDDVVIVAGWNIENGARVRTGDSLVDIETSKSVLEIVAEADGYVQILHAEGAEVPIGEVIGRILPEPVPIELPSKPEEEIAATESRGQADYILSGKAKGLVEKHGIEPSLFAGRGLIRESDVLQLLEENGETEKPGAGDDEMAASSPKPADQKKGGLLGDARAAARDRGHSLFWHAWNYLWRNWLLGNLVKIAPRGVIDVLHRIRGVRLGRNCFIDPSATLETAYPENITLGNDVRVTVGAIIMTHIKAPDYLRENGLVPLVLKPVVLEDHCFIGVNACIMPGVTVGKASVVASGSVVVADVPPFTMVAGNPANVIKRFSKPGRER